MRANLKPLHLYSEAEIAAMDDLDRMFLLYKLFRLGPQWGIDLIKACPWGRDAWKSRAGAPHIQYAPHFVYNVQQKLSATISEQVEALLCKTEV